MTQKDIPRFEDWETEKIKAVAFMVTAEKLEPGD
jgi:hypothetical protein